MLNALFVYGTLRAGGGQGWRLAEAAVLMGQARMAGRLYRLDGYPGLVLNGAAEEWVLGEVYSLRDPGPALEELDRYEGDEYTRERGAAVMHSGDMFDCWVYVYRGPLDEARRIESGDFLS